MEKEEDNNTVRKHIGTYADVFSGFVDENLQVIRGGTSFLIFSYIVFTLKKTRGFYRFSNIRNIPDEDFRHRIKLNGIITDVDNKTGIVKFFHRPIFLRIFNPEYHKIMTEEERVKLKNKSLKIKLYGINTENSLAPPWLSSTIKRQAVELTLFANSLSDHTTNNVENSKIDDDNDNKIRLHIVHKDKDSFGEIEEIKDINSFENNDIKTEETIRMMKKNNNDEKDIIYGKIRCRIDGNWFKKDIAELALNKGLASVMLDVDVNGKSVVAPDVRDNEMVKLEKTYVDNETYAQQNNLGVWKDFEYKPSIAETGKNILSILYNSIRNRFKRKEVKV